MKRIREKREEIRGSGKETNTETKNRKNEKEKYKDGKREKKWKFGRVCGRNFLSVTTVSAARAKGKGSVQANKIIG